MVFNPTMFVQQRFQPQTGNLFTAARIAPVGDGARQGKVGNSSPMRARQSQSTNFANENRRLGEILTDHYFAVTGAFFKNSAEMDGCHLMERRMREERKTS
jgi:hypothetical protein